MKIIKRTVSNPCPGITVIETDYGLDPFAELLFVVFLFILGLTIFGIIKLIEWIF